MAKICLEKNLIIISYLKSFLMFCALIIYLLMAALFLIHIWNDFDYKKNL